LESGQVHDTTDVEKFGNRSHTSNNDLTRPFKTVRKREEVDIQWVRDAVTVVSHNLSDDSKS
jgi:alkyl hydroperoxide reductase subunit AhpF